MPENFQRVEDNIYRGGEPSPQDLQMLHDVYHIKRVVSLDAAIASKIAPTLKGMGIEQIVAPLNATDTGMTDALNLLSRNIVTWLTGKQPVYIHCAHGRDRTGFAIALYRVKHNNWPVDQAINEAKKFGYGLGIAPATQALYKQILTVASGKKDVNTVSDKDIVQDMRDAFDLGNVPPAFQPQQSFAPLTDDPKEKRRIIRTKVLQDMADANDIPLIGEHDNSGAIRGADPFDGVGITPLG